MAAGSVPKLFALLKDWSQEDLDRLRLQMDAYWESFQAKANEATEEAVFRPEIFLSPSRTAATLKAKDDTTWEAFAVLAEIGSVVEYFRKGGDAA